MHDFFLMGHQLMQPWLRDFLQSLF